MSVRGCLHSAALSAFDGHVPIAAALVASGTGGNNGQVIRAGEVLLSNDVGPTDVVRVLIDLSDFVRTFARVNHDHEAKLIEGRRIWAVEGISDLPITRGRGEYESLANAPPNLINENLRGRWSVGWL